MGPRSDHFTNNIFLVIQIRWNIILAVIQSLDCKSLQFVAHGTTTLLSWHVQNLVGNFVSEFELRQNEISIEFELQAKNRSWNGLLVGPYDICYLTHGEP